MAQLPNLVQGPEPVETGELHFKLYCKLKVFETETKYEKGHCCLLAVSQYYGLIFVGNCNGFSVIKTKSLSPVIDLEKFPKRDVTLNLRPTHISVDFSQKILAVVCSSKPGSVLVFYNIQSFGCKDVAPLKVIPIAKITQNLTAEVVDLTWQPNTDGCLMLCISDGSVLAFSQGVKDGSMFTLPSTTQATCFCWSPKGKQIVVGTATGTLSQYKPDLKVVKTLPPPPLFNGGAMVVNVLWISSYQFAVAYNDRANPESFPVITIVNAAKNEPVNVINYDDITYSTTLFRNHQIYMTHQSAWNLIFVSSANSIEVAVLHSKDGSSWIQWLLGDASRAELPLDPDRQETFPLGWAFDFTSQEVIPWGEGTLPPMPRLLLVSDEGLLCAFNIVNAMENAPQLCVPPKENLDDSLFAIVNKTQSAQPTQPTQPIQSTQAIQPSQLSQPVQPSQLSQPIQPSQLSQPIQPSQLSQPVQPSQLTQPVQPSQLSQSVQPSQLTQPIQPTFEPPEPVHTKKSLLGSPPVFGNSKPTYGFEAVSGFGGFEVAKPPTATVAAAIPQVPHPMKKDLAFFASKNIPQFTSKKQSDVSLTPEKPVTTPPSLCKSSETVVPAGKAEEVTAHGESPIPGTPELAAVDDSVYLNALQEEIEHFSSELQQLSAKVSNLDVIVGKEEDKVKMKKSIDGLYDFWKELKETTEGQSGEIHAVVMDLMEAFAWLEDAKSRNLQRKNPSYIELKKSEELDPLSSRHMSEIAHLKYYIENQLKQLTRYLEKEWMDYQENYRNEVKNRMAVPPLEEVYKTMHFQLKILHKQKALVEELKERIAARKRKIKSQSFLNSIDSSVQTHNSKSRVSELSKLAENLLQLKINKEENSPRTGTWEMMKVQLSAISERSKKLTREKQTALREALSECDTVKIRPVKTTLESSSFLRSLALEKVTPKPSKLKPAEKAEELKGIEKNSSPKTDIMSMPKIELEVKPQSEPEKPKISKKRPAVVTKPGIPKSGTISVEKPLVPLAVQSLPKQEEKSPLDSLSGIVSNIGKKDEAKSPAAFVFGSVNFQKPESPKSPTVLSSPKSEQKEESSETTQIFMFTISKRTESVFYAKEPTVEDERSSFSFSNSTPMLGTSLDLTKTNATPNVTITPITTTPPITTSPQFILNGDKTTTNSTNLPVVKSLFHGKKQSPEIGTSTTTASLFFAPSTAIQTSASSIFGTTTPIFGVGNKNPTTNFGSVTPSLSNIPKTSSETLVQPSGFTFTPSVESKSTVMTSTTIANPIKPTSETEEIDVEKVDEPTKKQETPTEKSKDAPKESILQSIFASPPAPTSTIPEVTVTSFTPPNVSVVSTLQSSMGTVNVFAKPVATSAAIIWTTSNENSSTSTPASCTTTTATKTMSSVFSFSTTTTPVMFGQTVTTATATITSSPFGTSTSITNVFGQASSTTPSINVFGGSAPTTITKNIFGGSTPAKPIFAQAATPSTTSESIFKVSTSTINTFGQISPTSSKTAFSQVSTPPSTAPATTVTTTTTAAVAAATAATTPPPAAATTPDAATTSPADAATTSSTTTTIFGQVSTTSSTSAIAQTTNLFDQLLSDNTQSMFGTSSATSTTTSNTFSIPKNIFGGGGTTSTTTASLFGNTSSSVFPQTTSIFGQPTTSPSLFGQSQTATSNSFFGQNICSPFGSGTSVTSNQSTFDSGGFSKPIFGQSAFGQSTSNTSMFGGSSTSSLFRGTSNTTTSNVFQTPTTSTTFGSTSSEPFSSSSSSFGTTASSFQKPLGGFGSPPIFGGAPAFGSSATFGGSPSFGSLPSFGSMSQETFGQTTGSTTFENLANQNTVGFGNLAQQSQSQGFGGGFGSPTFENKAAFGSTSFSSWRSK